VCVHARVCVCPKGVIYVSSRVSFGRKCIQIKYPDELLMTSQIDCITSAL